MTHVSPAGLQELIEDVLGAACWGAAPGSLVDLADRRPDVLRCATRRVNTLPPGRLGGRPRGVVHHDLQGALALATQGEANTDPTRAKGSNDESVKADT